MNQLDYNMAMKRKALLLSLIFLGVLNACEGRTPTQAVAETSIATPAPTQTTTPQQPAACKKIALVLIDGANSDIYTVCPDGSELVNITNEWLADFDPAWSPDGGRIAFATTRWGNTSHIYIMDADGKYPQRLTEDYENTKPIWLPNGHQVAFLTTDGQDIWWWRIFDLTTYEITDFTVPSYDLFFPTPAWSPDGQYLAYMSLVEQEARNDGSSQIHLKNLSDSSDVALTNDIWANISPFWSHDGERIGFFSERDGTYNLFALYVMNRDGSGLRRLTEPEFSQNVIGSWSPDGREIALGNSAVMRNIFIVNVETEEVRKLLELPEELMASSPAWQP